MEDQAKQQKWWQKNRVAIGCVIIFIVLVVIIIAGYWFDWTGFNGYNKVTITHIISGTNAGEVTKTEEYQPGKSLWDWLGLLGVLAIPVVVGFGVAWFTTQQGKVADAENKDNQREVALQDYINKISGLLLQEKGLRNSQPQDEIRKVARVRTLTVLPRLDAARKRSVLQFLYESELIMNGKNIIDLSGANLRGANLRVLNLRGVDLRGAYLREANLWGADLEEANLSGAQLQDANLQRAILSNANLFGVRMERANLRAANLSRASLMSADLTGVNLKDATITKEQLEGIGSRSLRDAIMPDDSKYSC
jgi:uncharacterized protein YjbI with pentapeptide repeats